MMMPADTDGTSNTTTTPNRVTYRGQLTVLRRVIARAELSLAIVTGRVQVRSTVRRRGGIVRQDENMSRTERDLFDLESTRLGTTAPPNGLGSHEMITYNLHIVILHAVFRYDLVRVR